MCCCVLVETKTKSLQIIMKTFGGHCKAKKSMPLNNTWKAATLVAISTGMPIPHSDVMVDIGVLSSRVE